MGKERVVPDHRANAAGETVCVVNCQGIPTAIDVPDEA